MANTHKGVTGNRRPVSRENSAKRRQHTDEVLNFLKNGLDEMKKENATKKAN
ncbi:hypothetical protein [Bombilactobacillus thymidiniphilus]|uniref:Uncharacterized protein n=1 Tax=Bombilactobacillus thymidiniphilus TaxID=2923363 RepID=A0ABY4PF31_9LACO|nr:hypothetical protein [Bombilactobacillus thymidiniphilus]UQS84278.1 hypothetical protein MOO47_03775 [Bombilactobacillus thymidiniphilus]